MLKIKSRASFKMKVNVAANVEIKEILGKEILNSETEYYISK